MNNYSFLFPRFLPGSTKEAGVTDPTAAEKLCRQIGYLWLNGKKSFGGLRSAEISGDPAELQCWTGLDFMTDRRLPRSLEIGQLESITGGSVRALVSEDNGSDLIVQNLDRPIVQRGNLIVAISFVDVSAQLENYLSMVVGNDATLGNLMLYIGTATASAQEGVYDVPFSDAIAIANLGNSTNVPIVVSNV